jgi:membrane associated rhomboid family serine protease
MIPLKDDVPSRSFPSVTVGLVALNVIAFLYQVSLQISDSPQALHAAQDFVFEFGVMPCRLTGNCPVPGGYPSPVLTIFTSMFLHGGWFHLLGNMLYLWIFGDNVEDRLGHGRFLVFYLSSGVAAALAQTVASPTSRVPMVGASGAVSGVLGAYLVLFPFAAVLTLVTFGFFVRIVRIPAMIVLGLWIVVQLINGTITYSMTSGREDGGGVAWFAHVGGFAAGLILLFLLRPSRDVRL